MGAAVPAVVAAPALGAGGGGRGGPGRVVNGVDRLAAADWSVLSGQRVGVVTNPTGILADLTNVVDAMAASGKVDLVGVFGPEHGFRGTAQAGESEGSTVDERTGVTVYDAYGADRADFAAMFREARVETVVFDIQDVGARFYTYVWTMYTAMTAAVDVGARFVVLDRPNPTGGTARGPMMTAGFTSAVGQKEIVQQHGMTVGELARFFDGEFLEAETGGRLTDLEVVEVRGWRRDQLFADTGLTWVPPSPNMPTPDTALLYPGTCLFEAVTWSEGRGTTRPFETVGAPGVPYGYAAALRAQRLRGVRFRETYFVPTFSKHLGTVCGGVQVHVDDPDALDPVRLGIAMLVEARDTGGGTFDWRPGDPPENRWIDKLTGSTRVRDQIEDGAGVDAIVGAWKAELAAFVERRRPYLLYPGKGRR
ncbi:MAG: DUF1343 domain-containing protein [Nocardioidaceae bacterium]|nr:DUF1343 domain-containing protein [Nocardioidaceae bacterium]